MSHTLTCPWVLSFLRISWWWMGAQVWFWQLRGKDCAPRCHDYRGRSSPKAVPTHSGWNWGHLGGWRAACVPPLTTQRVAPIPSLSSLSGPQWPANRMSDMRDIHSEMRWDIKANPGPSSETWPPSHFPQTFTFKKWHLMTNFSIWEWMLRF